VIPLLQSYAYGGLFLAVLLDTIGLPMPGEVVLLAAGFLVSTGRLEPIPAILVAALGAVLGDSVTYWLGRRAGVAGERRLVGLYCTWTACTLGSAHCVERAEGLLRRFRGWIVLVAKFIAGARVFVPPIAGASALSFRRFLLFDAAGSLLWAAPFIGVGAALGLQRETAVGKFVRASDLLPVALAGFLVVYLAWKVAWRRRYGPPSSPLATRSGPESEEQGAESAALRARTTP
jgi:membrane protein DedA with SNARE-associated domain